MYRGKREKAVDWDRRLTAAAGVLVIGAILIGQITLADCKTAARGTEVVPLAHSAERTVVWDEPVKLICAAEAEYEGEDPLEDEKITAALVAQGYFRENVPLDFILQDITQTACEQYGVDYALVLGLMDVESDFDTEAVNAVSGCYGLMQLNQEYFPAGLTPIENIQTGVAFLAEQIERYEGDIPAALCAYNAGHDTGSRVYAGLVQTEAEKWAAVLGEEVKER